MKTIAQMLAWLYFKPSRLFADLEPLKAQPRWLIVAWLAGIAAAIDRFDMSMIKSDLVGRSGPAAALMDSWVAFWFFVVAMGAIYAALVWLIGGWWYRVRVQWSGDADADSFSARIVYIYQDLVAALPAIAATVVQTAAFANYREAWASDEAWSGLLVIFIVWSCIASYKAVRAAFAVSKWKARFWFLIVPLGFYLTVGVVIGVMYAARYA
jgi:hypothetical protein